ncbi:helix-turn-helix transcriptional regulator [Maribacter sp. 2210JD10-5]|uniref:AraC family transcriptional regulator n=1 Tax=Maribacter sp. 2210JD10-5 TaxID=3386272 RepID=UPI0039BCADE1
MRYEVHLDHHKFYRNGLIVLYFKNGSGVFVSNPNQIKVKSGHFVILNPNEGLEYINDKHEYLDVLSFDITNKLISECNYYLQQEALKLLDNPFGEIQEDSFFLENSLNAQYYSTGILLQQIYNLSGQRDFELTSADELTIELLQSLYREQKIGYKITDKIEAKKLSTKEETLKRLLVAYEYIHDNLGEAISIDELSKTSSLSKFHLFDSFKKAFGRTPHQYMNRIKVAKAKELVQNGNLSVSEVSDSLGFSDLSVFSKVFKKAYGRPPSHFQHLN